MEFTGTQKIAVILLALGDKFASDVFNRMTRSEITNISRAIMELDSVSKEEVEAILNAKDKNYVIGTQAGTTGYMYSNGDADFDYDGFTNLTTKAYNTGALALMDLANGKINAVILDKQPSLMIVESLNK